jgi:GNAT superfamily N-acetyltransferase
MEIRDAAAADAPAAAEVLRRSIVELCQADHGNDPAILAEWLANKSAEMVAHWIAQPGNSVLVAVEAGTILAVGSVTDAGTITLNYVAPEARFRGISHSLLDALETRAQARGNAGVTLISTATARRFYLGRGYVETGAAVMLFGARSYPMAKTLDISTVPAESA